MTQNLKAGDLALITGAFSVTENIGRSVELVEFVPPFCSVFCQDGYFDADAPGLWIVTGNDLVRNAEGGKVISNLAGCDPQHLRPLRGDEVPQLDAEEMCHLFKVPA
ncbi:hypothetical protein ACIPZC_20385 [Pseudomonas sp. NPDC089743]|uniref:hypothetical protein n=1 Tax=Pseudomonas sp. NPDC089743 TaxID=3364471 RepID=UPI0037FF0916